MSEIQEQIQQILNKLEASEERQKQYEEELARELANRNVTVDALKNGEDEDIETEITSGDQIQLESYKVIPEFSGQKGQYRSWRNQVMRRMKMIDEFKKHVKYEAALAIIRAKITGAASNVLTNNKTAYNIIAIIKTLDSSYGDQRPLYVVEAEMTSIKQLGKTLQEFHDVINQALHMVISKIVLAYKTESEQKSLVAEAQQKAVRTFTVGLDSQMMRHILYSRKPGSLAEAFTIAQTVYYDHQYTESQVCQTRFQKKPNSSAKFNPNYNKPIQKSTQSPIGNKPEPIIGVNQIHNNRELTKYRTNRENKLKRFLTI